MVGEQDRDVHYLDCRNAELPIVVSGALARGAIPLDDVGDAARPLIEDLAPRFKGTRLARIGLVRIGVAASIELARSGQKDLEADLQFEPASNTCRKSLCCLIVRWLSRGLSASDAPTLIAALRSLFPDLHRRVAVLFTGPIH